MGRLTEDGETAPIFFRFVKLSGWLDQLTGQTKGYESKQSNEEKHSYLCRIQSLFHFLLPGRSDAD